MLLLTLLYDGGAWDLGLIELLSSNNLCSSDLLPTSLNNLSASDLLPTSLNNFALALDDLWLSDVLSSSENLSSSLNYWSASDDGLASSDGLGWSDGVSGYVFFSHFVFVFSDFSSERLRRGLVLSILLHLFSNRLIISSGVSFFLWNIFNDSVGFFIRYVFSNLLYNCCWDIISLCFNSVIFSPHFLNWNLYFFSHLFVFSFNSILSVIFNSSFSLFDFSFDSWNKFCDWV